MHVVETGKCFYKGKSLVLIHTKVTKAALTVPLTSLLLFRRGQCFPSSAVVIFQAWVKATVYVWTEGPY